MGPRGVSIGLGVACWRVALGGESGESERNFRVDLAGGAAGLGKRGLGSVFVGFALDEATKIPPGLYKSINLDGDKKRLYEKYKSFINFYHNERTLFGGAKGFLRGGGLQNPISLPSRGGLRSGYRGAGQRAWRDWPQQKAIASETVVVIDEMKITAG